MLSSKARLLRRVLHGFEGLLAGSSGLLLLLTTFHPSLGVAVMMGLGGLARASRGILVLRWQAQTHDAQTERRASLEFLVVLGLVVLSCGWFASLLWPSPLLLGLVWLAWVLINGVELLRWLVETALLEQLTTGHGSAYWLVETAPQRRSRRRQHS